MKNIILFLTLGLSFLIHSVNQAQSASSIENLKTNYYSRIDDIKNADVALKLLVDGNKRFVTDSILIDDLSLTKRKLLKEKGQKPFAVIVTCSDSRVPPELIFDQGLGDLFVIRVAGNVIDSVGMGSIQYAVEHLGIPLVLVLGHEKCGAVHATLAGGELPGSLPSIACRIQPSINKVKSTLVESNKIEELVIKANVDANIELLIHDVLLKHLIESGAVKTLGAVYQLETGVVNFDNVNQTKTHD